MELEAVATQCSWCGTALAGQYARLTLVVANEGACVDHTQWDLCEHCHHSVRKACLWELRQRFLTEVAQLRQELQAAGADIG
jgi:hypothetical protein